MSSVWPILVNNKRKLKRTVSLVWRPASHCKLNDLVLVKSRRIKVLSSEWQRQREGQATKAEMTASRCPVTTLICMQSTNENSLLKRKRVEKKEKDEIDNKISKLCKLLHLLLWNCHWLIFDHILPLVVCQEIPCYESGKRKHFIILFLPSTPATLLLCLEWENISTVILDKHRELSKLKKLLNLYCNKIPRRHWK